MKKIVAAILALMLVLSVAAFAEGNPTIAYVPKVIGQPWWDHVQQGVEAWAADKGIDVIYIVTRKLRFQGPLNVTGNDYWSVSKITKLSELKDGYAYGEADFEAAAGRVKREYQKKFFLVLKVVMLQQLLYIADVVAESFGSKER
jgi:hypothetical protein